MLEIKYVRQNLSAVRDALAKRGDRTDLSTFEKADDQRRRILNEMERLRHERNTVSDEIARKKKRGEAADDMVADMRDVSSRIKALEQSIADYEAQIHDLLIGIPNIPHESVPAGRDESDNPVVRDVGTPRVF